MADSDAGLSRRSAGRRGSGLLTQAPVGLPEVQVLCDTLSRLSGVTRTVTANIRNINESLDRVLQDKADVDELEEILKRLAEGQ